MKNFLKSMTDWMLEKEAELAKECAVPMQEIDNQIARVESQKEKLQKKNDEMMAEFDDILNKLHKIKNSEILRCQNK